MVQLAPKITYYFKEEIFYQLGPPEWAKQEVFMAILASSLLGLGLARATGAGTSVLVLWGQNYRALRTQLL